VRDKIVDFIRFKSEHPLELYGSKDRAFANEGNLRGFIHAGLTFDVSIVYKIGMVGGKRTLDLYGVFSHDELGTGQPRNINRQRSAGEKLRNQEME
jgi:mRNA-degrading endonuclease YafQ of YafQ-DinJ toxin-antitoxin module